MKNILLIARRDFAAYLNGYSAYILIALMLFLLGLLFNSYGLGAGTAYSHEVLERFFELCGGFTMVTTLMLTMGSIAEEHQAGTDVLLRTAPISADQIVVGKYLAAMGVLGMMLLLSLYMPALILVNGKISLGHIAVGYFGLFCLGSATTSIGVAASAALKRPFAAGLVSSALVVTLLLGWKLSQITEAPFNKVFAYSALWDKHFPHFQSGTLQLRDVVFYSSLTFLGLLFAGRFLDGRRWQ